MRNILVLYGSETGNAQDAAERLGREAKARGCLARILPADSYMNMIEKLPTEEIIVCITSTTGQGEFPSNCSQFWRFLRRKSLSNDSLSQVKSAVFGLGDSGYPKYNYAAKLIHKRLETLGAKHLIPLGLGDDQHVYGYDAGLDVWMSQFWAALGLPESIPPYNLVSKCAVDAANQNDIEADLSDSYLHSIQVGERIRFAEHASMSQAYDLKCIVPAKIVENRRATPDDHFQDVRDIRIALPPNTCFDPGDSIAVWPKQNPDAIKYILERCGLQYDDVLRISYPSGAEDESTVVARAGNIVEGLVDVEGAPPRRTFIQVMSQLCPETMYKDRLAHLSSPQGRDEFHEYIMQEGRNLTEILRDFACVPITLEWIISYAPRIQPRYYSAASSLKKLEGAVDLLVALVEWKTPGRRFRKGLCSKMFANLQSGDEITVHIHKGDLKIPPPDSPLILIGPGTGVAPLRSFLQERHALIHLATPPPSILFFGCRNRSKDYFYEQEWQRMISDAVLSKVVVAPSREEGPKMYVQDAIRQHAAEVWDLLNQGGGIYVCGRADKMPVEVEKAILHVCRTRGTMTSESEAKNYLKSLQAQKRYQVECWS